VKLAPSSLGPTCVAAALRVDDSIAILRAIKAAVGSDGFALAA
jgi:hypothetical protein